MWVRKDLKNKAKRFLRKNYWQAFFAVLITIILTGGFANTIGFNASFRDLVTSDARTEYEVVDQSDNYGDSLDFSNDSSTDNLEADDDNTLSENTSTLMKVLIGVGVVGVSLFLFLLMIIFTFIGFVVEVGQSRFFLDGFKGDVSVSKVLSGFNAKEYMPIIKTQLLKKIYIFLWSLLFIIPGIIKAYSYRYVPYILAEHPRMKSKDAIMQSIKLTKGHKWNIFVLDLSFILWNMLSLVSFGFSNLFVAPYKEATNAVLYKVLKNQNNIEIEIEADDAFTVEF
ncbi:DUF975 family protein [Atopobacter phocae]|uniref:DUF975 family protein n=1 Tax=Atopobacter phocae TaxID=136492 RepID=UPI00046F0AF0|nr:DUF975 family protein [Atopobacter phocae]